MLNKNYAQTIAQIGYMTRPKVTKGNSIDFAGAIDAYYKAKDRKQAEEDRQLEKDRRDALTNAINNDETLSDTQKALFASDPNSYASFLQGNQNLANQRAMADYNHSLNMEMQDRKDAIAREIAQIKAGGNGLVNINMNNPFDKKRIETVAKNMDENIQSAQKTYDAYKRLDDLLALDTVSTGEAWDVARGGMKGNIGKLLMNEDMQNLQALINETIPTMKPAGSGTISDKDMDIFAKATVSFGNKKNANRAIAQGRMLAAQNAMDLEEMRAAYITNGMGSMSDFDREWRIYVNANPIFNNDGTLNKNRVSAQSWFGSSKGSTPSDENAFGDI